MDRKAWIVLIVCSILLAYNIHLQSKQSAAERGKETADQDKTEAPAGTNPDESPETTGEPVLEVKREPVGKEEPFELETATNRFLFSTLEGGIKKAVIKDELAVKDLDQRVHINDLGLNRIGALVTRTGESLDVPFYDDKSKDENSIVYNGTLTNGLGVRKTWKKTEGAGADYRLTLTLELFNLTENPISLSDIYLATGSSAPLSNDERENYLNFFWQAGGDFDSETQGYFKGGFFSKEKFEFTEEYDAGLDYLGSENQFFATIVDPADRFRTTLRARPKTIDLPVDRGGETATLISTYISLPDESLAPKAAKSLTFDIFMGPKNNSLIRSLEGEKGDVMDYGMFGWISRPLNWILNKLSNLFGGSNNPWSWGWAIVALTILIRAVMWPLHAKSTRTMKRMSKLQPKMAELKEKYPDDPNKMNQEMMKLYREFGVNPMGGCLPMLVQIPVFFGFFTMLQYAVELRNQPFFWVSDLSQPDTITTLPFGIPFLGDPFPINILPILMAVTMVLQMKMTPKTGDKMQQRIFMLMPIMFFFFCYNYASALALYWTTQNIFSIGQTWLMQKMPEPELKTSKKAGKKSMMQKLAERAEAAQKAKKQGAARPGSPQDKKPKKPRGPKTGG